jgi:hypothetical protein
MYLNILAKSGESKKRRQDERKPIRSNDGHDEEAL